MKSKSHMLSAALRKVQRLSSPLKSGFHFNRSELLSCWIAMKLVFVRRLCQSW